VQTQTRQRGAEGAEGGEEGAEGAGKQGAAHRAAELAHEIQEIQSRERSEVASRERWSALEKARLAQENASLRASVAMLEAQVLSLVSNFCAFTGRPAEETVGEVAAVKAEEAVGVVEAEVEAEAEVEVEVEVEGELSPSPPSPPQLSPDPSASPSTSAERSPPPRLGAMAEAAAPPVTTLAVPRSLGDAAVAPAAAALPSADSAAQLAAVSSRLSAVAAHLASRAAEAAMAPVHQLHALLHEDILRFMARCQLEMEIHASVHESAISKVKSIVTLLWPRAQVPPSIHLYVHAMRSDGALHARC
tara:strand:- start:1288 stop:2199 length:912 start_codon:yes stop_codon:yes gene_type:complete